jgi:hypothetical protein
MNVLVRKVGPILEILGDGTLVTIFDAVEELAAQTGVMTGAKRPATSHLATAAGTESDLRISPRCHRRPFRKRLLRANAKPRP